jgi:hypothetical protein
MITSNSHKVRVVFSIRLRPPKVETRICFLGPRFAGTALRVLKAVGRVPYNELFCFVADFVFDFAGSDGLF